MVTPRTGASGISDRISNQSRGPFFGPFFVMRHLRFCHPCYPRAISWYHEHDGAERATDELEGRAAYQMVAPAGVDEGQFGSTTLLPRELVPHPALQAL